MLTHEQTKTAYDLLAQADVAFDAGDEILGSRKLWEAFADAMNAIARKRGLPPCRDDDDIRRVLKQIANEEIDYLSLAVRFHAALRFRRAAAKDGPEDYEVEFIAPEIPGIIDDLFALA